MANGFDSAVDRRLKGLLPAEDFAAMNTPGGAVAPGPAPGPAAGAGVGSIGDVLNLGSPGVPFANLPNLPGLDAVDPSLTGQAIGFDAVARRQAALSAAGAGSFVDPRTGQPAQFGGGQFSRSPAMFLANTGQGETMNDRIRNFSIAVRRRLEELMGQGSEFASPTANPDIVNRGRFGT